MTDVFPRRNLPDDGTGNSAVPWGREVENRIIGAEKTLEALSQLTSGGNRSTASSLQSLSEQLTGLSEVVTDLSRRRIYRAPETPYSEGITLGAATPWLGPKASTIRFTLEDYRAVKVDLSVYYTALAFSKGVLPYVSPTVSTRLYLRWNNPSLDNYSPLYFAQTESEGENSEVNQSGRIAFWDSLLLSPGDYEVSFQPEVIALAAAVSGSASFQNPRLIVQVLERWRD